MFLKNYGTQQSTFDLSSLRNYPYRNFIVIAYDGYHRQEFFWIGVVQVGTDDLTAVNKIFSLSGNYNIYKDPDKAYRLTTNNPNIYIYGITVYTVLDPRSYNLAEII